MNVRYVTLIEFVTDRTQQHVKRLKKLQSIGWENLSSSQKKEYQGYAAKGAYNYTDLNRVEAAVAEIAPALGLTLSTSTDWTNWSTVHGSLDRYLNNVKAIRDACPGDLGFPPLPDSMNHLTYEGANNIEKVLEIAYRYSLGDRAVLGHAVLGVMVLGKEE